MRHPSDEAVLFGRLAIFGVVVGLVYWFLTYEPAGTVMLLGFGIASGVATVALWARPSRSAIQGTGEAGAEDLEFERIPAPAFAPVIVGAGVAITALGVALGALILPVGVIVVLIGARYWLQAAMREADARDAKT